MNTQREQLIQTWISTVLQSDQAEINFLAGDASFRRYARITLNNKTFMLMDAPPEKEDCVPFVTIDEFFDQNGVRVPHIIAKDLDNGFLLLEDFGDVVLSTLLNDETVDAHYAQSFKQLVQLQSINGEGQLPAYSYEKLISEMELLTDWLLPSLDIQPSKEESVLIKRTFAILANAAVAQPQVIVHRDFHSRNLMKIEGETEQGVIDFQDAVIGAYSYDLVSLVRDAYVEWPEDQVSSWIQDCWKLQKQAGLVTADNAAQFENDVNVMGVQRHLKVLGIFIRLFERDGKSRYLADIPKVMRDLIFELEWLAEHGNSNMQQAVTPFNEWLRESILPAYQHKFVQQYI